MPRPVLKLVEDDRLPATRRSAWRQRLVDAETGFRLGLRSGSTLVGGLFFGGVAAVVGAVLGLSGLEWAVLTLSLGTALSAEFFLLLMKQLAGRVCADNASAVRALTSLGAAAATMAQLTALLVAVILFGQRFLGIWSA